jgi:phosphoglycolate phosphatase
VLSSGSTIQSSDVYFDLDGTLTDPFEGISKSIVYALERLGEDPPDEAVLRSCIGPPLLASFESMVGGERAQDALGYYRERFGDVGWQENEPYEGMHVLLDALVGENRNLYVATSKPRVFANKIVDHFGFASFFIRVFGSELDGRNASKVDLLSYALAQTNSADAVMVGDRKHDVIGALENGLRPIGVSWGYGSKKELNDAGATQIVASPARLLKLLQDK